MKLGYILVGTSLGFFIMPRTIRKNKDLSNCGLFFGRTDERSIYAAEF